MSYESQKEEISQTINQIEEKTRILVSKGIRIAEKNKRAISLFEEISRNCNLPEQLIKKIEAWNKSV